MYKKQGQQTRSHVCRITKTGSSIETFNYMPRIIKRSLPWIDEWIMVSHTSNHDMNIPTHIKKKLIRGRECVALKKHIERDREKWEFTNWISFVCEMWSWGSNLQF